MQRRRYAQLAKNLRRLRAVAGIPLDELARKTQIPLTRLQAAELCRARLTDIESAKLFKALFGNLADKMNAITMLATGEDLMPSLKEDLDAYLRPLADFNLTELPSLADLAK